MSGCIVECEDDADHVTEIITVVLPRRVGNLKLQQASFSCDLSARHDGLAPVAPHAN